MVREPDTVVLTHDIEEFKLKRGDVGAVVHCYPGETSFEVGFVTLAQAEIRPMHKGEILHAREIQPA